MTVRARVMLAWLAVIASCTVYSITSLRVDADFSAFLPAVATIEQRFLTAELKEGVASRMLLIEISGAAPELLARVSGALAGRLAADPSNFRYVNNGDTRWALSDFEVIRAHRYQLSDAIAPERFSAEGLRSALQSDLRTLTSGAGLMQKELVAEDPTGEALHVVDRLTPRTQPRREHGIWFSPNSSAALLIAETRAAGSDLEGQARAIAALQSAFALADAGTGTTLRYSSPGAMAAQSRTVIAGDARRLALLSAGLILLILALVYRSVGVVVLCAMPALTGLAVGIPAVDLGFGGVHAITLGFGATLLGEAVDYPSYLLTQVRAGETAPETMGRLGRTLAMAVLTTAASSVAFLLSGFRGLAQLGLLTIVGVLTAGATTAWLLPRWVPSAWRPAPVPKFMEKLRLQLSTGARFVLVGLLAIGLVAPAATRTWWDDDLANMNPLPANLKERDRELRTSLGAPDVRWMLLIEGGTQEDVLQSAERLRPVLERAIANGTIDGFDLISDYLPSEATQHRRQAALPDTSKLRANFAQAAARLPVRSEGFESFFAAVERARAAPPVNAHDLQGTALGLKLEELLRRDGSRSYGVVPLAGVRNASDLRDTIAHGVPNIRWIDLQQASRDLMFQFRGRALTASGVGALLIVLVLAIGLRSIWMALRVALPISVAVIATAALLVGLGFRLTMFHLIALILVAGVGTNYALFLDRPRRQDEGTGSTVRSLCVVAATTLCAFGTLATSHVPVLQAIGITVTFGVIVSLAFSLLILPPSRPTAGEFQ